MAGTNITAYSGSQKAAILLLSFGEEISSEIFKHLNEFEIKRIGSAMSRLGRLDQEIIDKVILEFYAVLQKSKTFFYGNANYTKKLIGNAFKGGETEGLLEELALTTTTLESLELIDARSLAGFLRNEHPQTIALILSHLEPIKFSETLKLLPQALHSEILLRVSNLEAVAPEIIEEIEDVLRQEVQTMSSISSFKLGGVEAVANMLNLVDKNMEQEILDNLEERDPTLAEEVRKLMFTFDDLSKLDDRSMQEVIKGVSNDKWKIALKSSSDELKELVFRNMSERASAMLREDMEAMPAIKLSDVEKVQMEVLKITKKLEEDGKIILANSDVSYV